MAITKQMAKNIEEAKRGKMPSLTAKGSKIPEADMDYRLKLGAKKSAAQQMASPPAYKKGGKVKAAPKKPERTSSSKRGDGIAKKGFTKGKMR